jgi:hypothetical protein
LIVVDSHHLSEHQALAHAREFLAPRQPENVNAFWGLALINQEISSTSQCRSSP